MQCHDDDCNMLSTEMQERVVAKIDHFAVLVIPMFCKNLQLAGKVVFCIHFLG